MPRTSPFPRTPDRLLVTALAALSVAFFALDADARRGGGGHSGGGKPGWSGGGGKPGWSGGGGGHGWQGSGWRGGNHGGGWNGHRWHGNHHGGHGHHWRGYHGGHYYYPGWGLGLGVGIGLTYPWWGWYPSYGYPAYAYPSYGYPATTVVYEGAYDAPAGVVVGRDGPVSAPAPSGVAPAPAPAPVPDYRWYCPSPAGYHPDVRDCPAGWLRVVPEGGSPPPSSAPRSDTPAGELDPTWGIAPGTLGRASTTRLAAPRLSAPPQLAQRAHPPSSLAQANTR